MIKATPAPARPTHVEVAPLRPLSLRDRDAAKYLGRSASWIRAKRAEDVKAQREGRQPTGPKWYAVGPSIFYKVADLDEWFARNAVERGVVEFANRGGDK